MVESLEEKYGDTSNIVENILEENKKITPESPGYEVSRQRVADTEAKTQQLITNFREGFLSGTVRGGDGKEIPMAQAFGTLSDDALFDYAENYFPGGVDIEGMRNAGYSNEEIMSFLYGTSPKSYAEALATEGTRGTTEGVTATIGAGMGFQIGATTSPGVAAVSGPLAPITVPTYLMLTTLTGLGAGLLFGKGSTDLMLGEKPTYYPGFGPGIEASYTAGHVFAGGTSPYSLSKLDRLVNPGFYSHFHYLDVLKGKKFSTNAKGELIPIKSAYTPIQRIQKSALESPLSFMTTEASMGSGAATGSYLAEKYYPGDLKTKLIFEAGLGTFSPVTIAAMAGEKLIKGTVGFGRSFTTEGRQLNQANKLYAFLEKHGENPEEMLKILSDPKNAEFKTLAGEFFSSGDAKELGLGTTAQVLDSEALGGLINTIMSKSSITKTGARIDPKSYESLRAGLEPSLARDYVAISRLIALMMNSGDKTLINQAAKMREAQMKSIIIERLDVAKKNALETINKIVPTDSRASIKSGNIIKTLTKNALQDARKQESKLYKLIDGEEIITVPAFLKALKELEADTGGDLSFLPPEVKNFIIKAKGGDPAQAAQVDEKMINFNKKINLTEDRINETLNLSPILKSFFEEHLSPKALKANTIDARIIKLQELLGLAENAGPKPKVKLSKYNKLVKESEGTPGLKLFQDFIKSSTIKGEDEKVVEVAGEQLKNILTSKDLGPKAIAQRYLNLPFEQLRPQDQIKVLNYIEGELLVRTGYSSKPYQKKRYEHARKIAETRRKEIIASQEADPLAGKSIFEKDFSELDTINRNRLKSIIINLNKQATAESEKLKAETSLMYRGSALSDDDLFVDNTIDLREAMYVRSRLLNSARMAISANNLQDYHYYNRLADGILDDFNIRGDVDFASLTKNEQALKTAHSFSKSLNDVFSRAFPSSIVSRAKSGADDYGPEGLMSVTLSGGGDATSLRFDQMAESMIFLAKELGDDAGPLTLKTSDDLGSLRSAQNDFLNVAFEELVDPLTNRITEGKLAAFKRKYRNVLNNPDGSSNFPNLIKDLDSVESAERLLSRRIRSTGDPRADQFKGSPLGPDVKSTGTFHKKLKNQITFYDSLGSNTNPTKLLSATIGSPGNRPENAEQGFKTLMRNTLRAERKFKGATDGLRDMILERAFMFATGKNIHKGASDLAKQVDETAINFRAFREFLNSPLTEGGVPLLELMRQGGVIDSDFAVRLNQAMEGGISTQNALEGIGKGLGPAERLPIALSERFTDLFIHLAGLRAGRLATRLAPGKGQGLAEPPMIGGELTAIFTKMPNIQVRDLFVQAVEDPAFFKILMEKAGPSVFDANKLLRSNQRLRAYLINSGYTVATEGEVDLDEGELIQFRDEAIQPSIVEDVDELIRERDESIKLPEPLVLSQNIQPNVEAPTQTASASGPVDRNKYAALFPNDMASNLIKGGIGGLMG